MKQSRASLALAGVLVMVPLVGLGQDGDRPKRPPSEAESAEAELSRPEAALGLEEPARAEPRTWALLVGSEGARTGSSPPRRFAAADVRDLYLVLTEPDVGGLPPERVALFASGGLWDSPTREAVGAHLDELAGRLTPADTLLVVHVGRSAVADGRAHLLFDDSSVEDLAGTALSLGELRERLDRTGAGTQVLWIDAPSVQEQGMKGADEADAADLVEELDHRSDGWAVLSASGPGEQSYESPAHGHGLFAAVLLDGLAGAADVVDDGRVTLLELADHVAERLPGLAGALGVVQDPRLAFNLSGDLVLSRVRRDDLPVLPPPVPTPEPLEDVSEYFPAAAGMRWSYSQVREGASRATGLYQEVLGGRECGGGDCLLMRTDLGGPVYEELVELRSDGVVAKQREGVSGFFKGMMNQSGDEILLKEGAVPGEEWHAEVTQGKRHYASKVRRRFVGFEEVTVPAGTFRCARLQVNRLRDTSWGPIPTLREEWHARGLGLVKALDEYPTGADDKLRYSLELESFARPGAPEMRRAATRRKKRVRRARRRPRVDGPITWALVVGVDRYDDPAFPQLSFAAADAKSFRSVLGHRELGTVPPQAMTLLADGTDRRPTRANILQALSDLESSVRPQDAVLVYFSGHGLQEGSTPYLIPSDARSLVLSETAIGLDELLSRLDRLATQRRVLILDACQSGAELRLARGDEASPGVGAYLDGAADSTLVLSSSSGSEPSWEMGTVGHGAFTWHLVEALFGSADRDGDGTVDIAEAAAHVSSEVSAWAESSGRLQRPRLLGRSETPLVLSRPGGSGMRATRPTSLQRPTVTASAVPLRSTAAPPLTLAAADAAGPAQTWAIVIGVDRYEDRSISSLRFSSADARALAEALTDPLTGVSAPERVVLLADGAIRRPRRSEILEAVSEVARRSGPEDTVLVFYSGHGLQAGGEPYLLPADTRSGLVADTGVSLRRLLERLRSAGVGRVGLLIDACESGVDPDSEAEAQLIPGVLGALEEDSGDWLALSSAGAGQFSWELEAEGAGAFTHHLRQVLLGEVDADADGDGRVTLREAARRVGASVSGWAEQTGRVQEPRLLGSASAEVVVARRLEAGLAASRASDWLRASSAGWSFELGDQVFQGPAIFFGVSEDRSRIYVRQRRGGFLSDRKLHFVVDASTGAVEESKEEPSWFRMDSPLTSDFHNTGGSYRNPSGTLVAKVEAGGINVHETSGSRRVVGLLADARLCVWLSDYELIVHVPARRHRSEGLYQVLLRREGGAR